jgi:hypothetical protein
MVINKGKKSSYMIIANFDYAARVQAYRPGVQSYIHIGEDDIYVLGLVYRLRSFPSRQ